LGSSKGARNSTNKEERDDHHFTTALCGASLLLELAHIGGEHGNDISGGRLQRSDERGGGPLQRAEQLGVHLCAAGHGLERLEVAGPVELALEDGADEVIGLLYALLLLEGAVGLERGRDLLGVDEEPGVHALHARLERLPGGALDGLPHQRVLRHQQVAGVRQRVADALNLLHREALIADAGQEVASLQLLADGDHRVLLAAPGDGRADGGAARARARA
jgi:hypothetical protein